MIPKETVDRILDSAQILEVVGDFVSLRRQGASYVACCPFHNEKTPSFYVTPSKGIFKCFGCGKSGTAMGFVMEHEGLSYVEALKYLAKKYHIEVVEKEETAEEIAARNRVESLYLVSDFAAKFFAEGLRSGEGRTIGYQYFRSRGLEDATIEKYGLGWSPASRHALADEATKKGYKEEYLVATGLCMKNEDGFLADRFFKRVMFPIHSLSGRVIAFGGRTLEGGHPAMKYVNSPETEIYVKSNSLYGLYFAKNEISRQDKCILVEGYLDVLSMHQLGITNVVASSGTSLTVPQIRLVRKFTENITIMYDGDSAGIHAALRGIELILREGMNVKVVLIPDGDDPDSYSRKHSLEEVEAFIDENERDFISFRLDLLLEEAGNDPLKRASLINEISDTIARIPDAVKRTVYAQSAGQRLDMSADLILDRIQLTRRKLLADERKASEREARMAARNRVVDSEIPPPAAEGRKFPCENSALWSYEEEIVGFLLENGLTVVNFDEDSEYYDEEFKPTVADLIFQSLDADGFKLMNSVLDRTYSLYRSYYDAEVDLINLEDEDEARNAQDGILVKMMNGEDRMVAALTADLSQEKYRLTMKSLAASMPREATLIVGNLPRSIHKYQSVRLKDKCEELKRQQKAASTEESMELAKEINRLTGMRKVICDMYGWV